MTELDDIRSGFEKKLETQRAQHSVRFEEQLRSLRAKLPYDFKSSLPLDLGREAVEPFSARLSPAKPAPPLQALLDLSGSTNLRDLDEAFIQIFDLGKYYPLSQLRYPTVYCESLDEFFTPLAKQLNLSDSARQVELQRLVIEAKETAEKFKGGGTFGYILPGLGAYLNGWLFTYGMDIPPRQAFRHSNLTRDIFATAAHEKLGHGFLVVYSALGQVETRLGLAQFEMASRFGLRTSDDPTARLRDDQVNLLFEASKLLEEGWSTWVANVIVQSMVKEDRHPRYQLKQVVDAIQTVPANQTLPLDLSARMELQEGLMGSIGILFGEQPYSMEDLHEAVKFLNSHLFSFDLRQKLEEHFAQKLGQPLRYVVGELLMTQAEMNLGVGCVPYAALIAANITFDPAAISLADLRDLLGRDPRLNPDARLAALSRLNLQGKKDIPSMVKHALDDLSMSVPKELR